MSNVAIRNATEEIYYGSADTITAQVYADGAAATPSAATAGIYDNGNNLIESPTVAITAGQLSIAAAAGDFAVAQQGCSVRWVVTISGAEYRFQTLFDCVRHKAPCPITSADLKVFFPLLDNELPTGQTNWETQITAAFREVKDDIWQRGYRGNEVIEPRQLKRLTTWKTLAIIFAALPRSTDSIWTTAATNAEEKYQALLNSERLWFDTDQDGAPDATSASFGTIQLLR